MLRYPNLCAFSHYLFIAESFVLPPALSLSSSLVFLSRLGLPVAFRWGLVRASPAMFGRGPVTVVGPPFDWWSGVSLLLSLRCSCLPSCSLAFSCRLWCLFRVCWFRFLFCSSGLLWSLFSVVYSGSCFLVCSGSYFLVCSGPCFFRLL